MCGVLERDRTQTGRALLRRAPSFDQARVFEHPEVLADRLGAHGKRRGELVDRGLAFHEAREDRPPSGIGERREGRVELVDKHLYYQTN